jgi:hypothetical protein
VQDLAEVSIGGVCVAAILIVEIAGEGERFDVSVHASFFVSFTGGGHGRGGIAIDSALGKGPAASPGANQEEFDFAVGLTAIADSSDHAAFNRTTPWKRQP